jgi:hypothetical protein
VRKILAKRHKMVVVGRKFSVAISELKSSLN